MKKVGIMSMQRIANYGSFFAGICAEAVDRRIGT